MCIFYEIRHAVQPAVLLFLSVFPLGVLIILHYRLLVKFKECVCYFFDQYIISEKLYECDIRVIHARCAQGLRNKDCVIKTTPV